MSEKINVSPAAVENYIHKLRHGFYLGPETNARFIESVAAERDSLVEERARWIDQCNTLTSENDSIGRSRDEARATIKELLGLLELFIYETTYLSPEEQDGSHFCWITKATLERARAILES